MITYKELEQPQAESDRLKEARQQEPRPSPYDAPYYGKGKPRPEQLARYWHRRALDAERQLDHLRRSCHD